MFYVYRSTTDKLADALTHITEAGDTIIQPTWVGGRDWIIVCRKAEERFDAAAFDTREQQVAAIAAAQRRKAGRS